MSVLPNMSDGATSQPAGRPPRSGVILALVCGAQFMFILDLAIVVLAIPSIQRDLGSSPSDIQWVVVVYGLTLGGFLLVGGRAADLFGRREVLVAGIALFAVGSLSAGTAQGLAPLVVSRGAQGLGAALAAPAALSILTATFAEGTERNKALGIFGAVAAAAASVGLVVGGALTSGPGWEWIFLMNVPIGIALIGLAVAYIPAGTPTQRGPLDVAGAASVTAGLMAIAYAIDQSVEEGWSSPATLGFVALGTTFLLLFVAIERRATCPLVPLSVFGRRTLTLANLAAALMFGSFLGFNLQMSNFMQQVRGYSAIGAGIAWLATSIGAVIVAIGFAARAVDRFGAARTLVAGQGCAAVGLVWLSRTPVDATYWADLFPGLLAVGLGIGASGTAAQVAAFIGIDRALAGLAGGMVEASRELGGAFGTAVVATAVVARSEGLMETVGTEAGGRATALTEGVQRGALVAAGFSITAALVAGFLLRRAERPAPPAGSNGPATDPLTPTADRHLG